MIIRKPYAFLIKNFKRIHIVLLILSLYVAYKLFDVSGFVSDFMRFESYDAYQNPVTNHITLILQLVLIILFVGSISLLSLLRYKGKPWKMYLIPAVIYLVLFFVLNMIKSFFVGYTNDVETTDLRLSRDLLMIFLIAQFPVIGIFIMRTFGFDINKFNFNSDQEFLSLSEEDREEIEISINVDKNSFLRFFRRLKRNTGYFYKEHKKLCRFLIVIFVVIIGYGSYKTIFVTHKSYSEGDIYNANGYTIRVNNSYYTDKDYKGDVITELSNFVVVDLTIQNNSEPRTIKIDNFHLKNGVSDFVTTGKIYEKEFQDLGVTYDSVKELKRGEVLDLIIIFKVDKKLKKNSFSLFYQENEGTLRKIKLKTKDVSKIEDMNKLELGDSIKFELRGKKQEVSLDDYVILDTIDYKYRSCVSTSCTITNANYTAPGDKRVLEIDFGSNIFSGKEMVDFSIEYGKIKYIDNNKEEHIIDFDYPLKKTAQGKKIITLVPAEVEGSNELDIVYTIRNKKYTYKVDMGE